MNGLRSDEKGEILSLVRGNVVRHAARGRRTAQVNFPLNISLSDAATGEKLSMKSGPAAASYTVKDKIGHWEVRTGSVLGEASAAAAAIAAACTVYP